MQRIALAFLLVLVLLPAHSLKADTLRTFSLEDRTGQPGGINNGTSTLSGLITIDVTTGQALFGFLQDSLTQSPLGQLNPPLTLQLLSNATNGNCITGSLDCLNFPNTQLMSFQSSNVGGSTFSAQIATPTSLVDYMGGDLCFTSGCDPNALTFFNYQNFSLQGGTISGTDIFNTGRLVLVADTAIPEPSTLILMGTGALGLMGTVKRRLRLHA